MVVVEDEGTQKSKRLDGPVEDDDEPDEWDKRIIKTGCHEDENLKLQLCHADTGDWRQCIEEMQEFKKCWQQNKNNERTHAKDNDMSGF